MVLYLAAHSVLAQMANTTVVQQDIVAMEVKMADGLSRVHLDQNGIVLIYQVLMVDADPCLKGAFAIARMEHITVV